MHPALALLEFDSIAVGIAAGDAMVKRGPVAELVAGTVHPGRYLVMVAGDVAAVEEALAGGKAVSGTRLLDEVFLPDVHPDVVRALRGGGSDPGGEALGVIETASVAASIEAADGGVKGASVTLLGIRLADGLGGKGYVLFSGAVSDVEAAVNMGLGRLESDVVVGSVVISSLHAEMAANMLAASRFGERIGWSEVGDATR